MPCWRNTKQEAQDLRRGLEPHLSKVRCPPCFSCRVLYQSLPYQETECFRPRDCATISSDHLSCMPMAEPKLGWHKRYSQLQARDGSLWLPQWLAPLARNPCGRTLVCDLWPSPLEHKELVLLLSCWKRWDHGSIPGSAINTWLKNVNLAIGPDCEDSPHFRRTGMDDLEAMRLLVAWTW